MKFGSECSSKLHNIYKYVIVALAVCFTQAVFAEADTETKIFNEKVKTLQLRLAGSPQGAIGMPVMILDSQDGIVIEFDHLAEDREYLRYSLTHCDANWRPDALAYVEYIDGFNQGDIDDYAFSQSTSVHYVHYTLSLPNAQIRPTISGNYLLKIYPEGDEDNVWLQCRFAISEQTASISIGATSRTDIDYNREHQQLEVIADVDRSGVRDMFNDLTLVLEQNGRNDNRRSLNHPLRISGGKLHYEHQKELIFPAGNEYRRFETVSKRYAPMGVSEVAWKSPYYRFVLNTDLPRSSSQYLYDETLSGGFVIRNADDVNIFETGAPTIEADYAVTYFSLEMPELPGKSIFIDSEITNRQFSPESAMVYNRATGCYEKAMLLKQGAYSYQYLVTDPGQQEGQTSVVEGNRYETMNHYTAYLYNRRPGERFDRLIGVASIITR